MRAPLRLLCLFTSVIAGATLCLCLAVAAWAGAAGTGAPAPSPSAVSDPSGGAAPAALAAVTWALAQLGTPYRWGGEGDGGFDCSGLVQAAYAAAGIGLPRVAQDQFDVGPGLAPAATLEPGDLVFFGAGSGAVEHVGMVVAPGMMVDAPHTGAEVRVEPFPTTVGARYGDQIYVGATRPAA
ncbi:MAG: C40 family peptidase [Acidimicrobiales bacterium]